MEFETEVHIDEDFSQWDNETKLQLIKTIAASEKWEFIGIDTVSYEPDDYP